MGHQERGTGREAGRKRLLQGGEEDLDPRSRRVKGGPGSRQTCNPSADRTPGGSWASTLDESSRKRIKPH